MRGQVSFEHLAILVFLLVLAAVIAIQVANIVSLKESISANNQLYFEEALRMVG